MRYRLVTTRADGEQRNIEYTTRRAVLGHFSTMAHSRNIIAASVLELDNVNGDHTVMASMAITRDAMPQEVDPE